MTSSADLRLRRRVTPFPVAWALTAVAVVAFAFFVVRPTVHAVYLSHFPTRRVVHESSTRDLIEGSRE